MRTSAHTDTFARDNLPHGDALPIMPQRFDYPDRLNVAVELTDVMVEKGFGDRIALEGVGRQRTYRELSEWTNQLAHVLVDDLGVELGNRVLIRSTNNPAFVACWIAVTKVGAVAVNTMPMLRASELTKYVDRAEVTHALCDARLMDELRQCQEKSDFLKTVYEFDGTASREMELDRMALTKPMKFQSVETAQDDVA